VHTSRTGFLTLPPPVKYIPVWFPGAMFQQIAKRSSELSDYIRNKPWQVVLERVRTRSSLLSCFAHEIPVQTARPEGYEDCIATRGIEKSGPSGTLRDAIAIMYSGMYALYGYCHEEFLKSFSRIGGAHTVSPCMIFNSMIRIDSFQRRTLRS
jgi:hypothetical protein